MTSVLTTQLHNTCEKAERTESEKVGQLVVSFILRIMLYPVVWLSYYNLKHQSARLGREFAYLLK